MFFHKKQKELVWRLAVYNHLFIHLSLAMRYLVWPFENELFAYANSTIS
jgi:hypothetical protein